MRYVTASQMEINPEGRFTPANIKGCKYWYFDIPDGHGDTKRRYVGPAEDPVIAQRVADHKRDKDDLRARRLLPMAVSFDSGVFSSGRWPFSAIRDYLASAFPWRGSATLSRLPHKGARSGQCCSTEAVSQSSSLTHPGMRSASSSSPAAETLTGRGQRSERRTFVKLRCSLGTAYTS
ncbi:hypothetical protein GA0061101_11524 [Rhizobium lusitanum]|jgi:hypothetical protein|uniref:Uncharacterized protein n=1 Tax=Rhizobium lusitanum TaxID=293958 RepID=A0A1C3WQB0_9HYPH|nr:hypothetical protein GA0061101_11524 [Rhizobium lusitanum]